jgi:isocitrate/isopropylmalate dehydrogenase
VVTEDTPAGHYLVTDAAGFTYGTVAVHDSKEAGRSRTMYAVTAGTADDLAAKDGKPATADPTAIIFAAIQCLREMGRYNAANLLQNALGATLSETDPQKRKAALTPNLAGGEGNTETFGADIRNNMHELATA